MLARAEDQSRMLEITLACHHDQTAAGREHARPARARQRRTGRSAPATPAIGRDLHPEAIHVEGTRAPLRHQQHLYSIDRRQLRLCDRCAARAVDELRWAPRRAAISRPGNEYAIDVARRPRTRCWRNVRKHEGEALTGPKRRIRRLRHSARSGRGKAPAPVAPARGDDGTPPALEHRHRDDDASVPQCNSIRVRLRVPEQPIEASDELCWCPATARVHGVPEGNEVCSRQRTRLLACGARRLSPEDVDPSSEVQDSRWKHELVIATRSAEIDHTDSRGGGSGRHDAARDLPRSEVERARRAHRPIARAERAVSDHDNAADATRDHRVPEGSDPVDGYSRRWKPARRPIAMLTRYPGWGSKTHPCDERGAETARENRRPERRNECLANGARRACRARDRTVPNPHQVCGLMPGPRSGCAASLLPGPNMPRLRSGASGRILSA